MRYFCSKQKRFMRPLSIMLAVALTAALFGALTPAAAVKAKEKITKILPMDNEWKYWYGDTSTPAAANGWEKEGFDDKEWTSLKGPLGYGAASKVPEITYSAMTSNNKVPYNSEDGTKENLKVPATYYRTTFNIENMEEVKAVSGIAHYDDAAIVYINGVERIRLGAFSESFDVNKSAAIVGGDATGAAKVDVPVTNASVKMKASWFKAGKNTVAIVMFQDTGSSSDCLLGFEITASDTLVLAKPDRINATFYGDTKTTKALTWISDGNGSDNSIWYIDASLVKDTEYIDWSYAKKQKASVISGTENINKVVLKNLTPATTYYYCVGGDGVYSDAGSFTTAGENDKTFSFLHVTDQQGSNEADFTRWAANIDGAYAAFPESEFIIDTGDFVNDGLNESEWKACLNLAADTLMNTTLVPVTGNHEGYDYLGSFISHFNLNSKANAIESKGAYYSFDYENVHFVVLNTDEKENEDLSQLQLGWMNHDLWLASQREEIDWTIVALHRSLYSSGDHSTDGDVINFRSSIGELLDRYHVDLVLSGHDHVYMRTQPIYNQIAQPADKIKFNGITYDVNPNGTTHVIPATISTKNYELNLNANYRILQPAKEDEKTYENGRDKFVSYSFLDTSRYYPEGLVKDSAAFIKIDINNNELVMNSYGICDGRVSAQPFDSYAILKDETKGTLPVKTKADEIKALNPDDYPFTGEGGSTAKDENVYEDIVYDAEADFRKNSGTQGDIWYYYYEEMGKLHELTPMKGKELADGTTGDKMESDYLYSQHPEAVNIGNDSVNNGAVRLFDGASDGNARPEGKRMTLVPYSDESNENGKDDIVVAFRAPKSGYIKITDWNPEFVGIIPAVKYLNSYNGFWVDIRIKKGASGNPVDAADYRADSVSLLSNKTYAEGDGVVSGGAPQLIDKGGPFDGTYTDGAFVQVPDLVYVEEGDYIYFAAHSGNNYGWRGVILDSAIKYVKK